MVGKQARSATSPARSDSSGDAMSGAAASGGPSGLSSAVEDSVKHPSDYESTSLTRSEYIAAIVHLYRGELSRATSWRMRLDNTTNWAVLTTAGILTLSLGERESPPELLLVGMVLVSVFWAFESRRYRFADIWYSRVRKIEENFYGPILRRNPISPSAGWGDLVAGDLFQPRFKISRFEALRTRLLRNYWAIYLVILLSWILKISIHPNQARDWSDVVDSMQIGGLVPPWVTVSLLGAFGLFLVSVILFTPTTNPDDTDHWKISP